MIETKAQPHSGPTVHCFFSGGRDSALACAVAKKVADVRGWEFRLVHIDTTIYIRETREYVYRYAEWLGAELVVIRPKQTFREYAAKYGMWPSLYPYKFRWCMRELKLKPTIEYLNENYRSGDIVALGIRKHESKFREKLYNHVFTRHKYGGKVDVLLWLPLLQADDATVAKLIRQYNIPESPVWRKISFSGECLCLAGMPLHKMYLLVRYYPEEFQQLLEIDATINRNRRSGKLSAPFRLAQAGLSLQEFYRRASKLSTLDDFTKLWQVL
jgi:3''-phosphoadenosine 5''-phosphosulfate sulfotransferase (PAPS reductase)/FAD synthetase and related enzymes